MSQNIFESYKLSATATRDGQSIMLNGTFGPFGFDAITLECNKCHSYIPDSTTVWILNGFQDEQTQMDATFALEDRLANAQVPKLHHGESTQINL